MECGGKRSATPLWPSYSTLLAPSGAPTEKRCRRFALPPHSKCDLSAVKQHTATVREVVDGKRAS